MENLSFSESTGYVKWSSTDISKGLSRTQFCQGVNDECNGVLESNVPWNGLVSDPFDPLITHVSMILSAGNFKAFGKALWTCQFNEAGQMCWKIF